MPKLSRLALTIAVAIAVTGLTMPLAIAQAVRAVPDEQIDTAPITDPVLLSLAAGYKATFTCSSIFNAGRTVEQIAGDELNRIYPDYREAFAQLPDAVVNYDSQDVNVSYSDNFPPRKAVWTGRHGCTQMPTGNSIFEFNDNSGLLLALSVTAPNQRRENRKQYSRTAWPQGDKTTGRLFTKTTDGKSLRATVETAFDRNTYGDGTETTAVLVIREGDIIAEKYRDGFDMHTPQRTWSVAKSIAASIIGAAVQQGIVAVTNQVELAQWPRNDPRRAITLENLLHMASGLDNGPAGNRTDDIYFGGGRVVDHAATRRLVEAPGSRWYYANNDTMLAMRFLREKMPDDVKYQNFPFTEVLDKIGMNHTYPETDWNGDFIMSSQVYTTARDLARLGLLYLNDGVWNGERIFPEGWVDYVTTPAPAQPPLRRDGTTGFGYGAQFWLLGGFSGLPADTYAALGNRGQHLVIIPSRQLIIIRRGFDDNGGAQFNIAQFAGDIVRVLDE